MRKLMLAAFMAALLAATASGQSRQGNLEQVLTLLDRTSTVIRSVQTDFDWDQYQKVVDEHDIQKGVMYFKRSGASVDVAADIEYPAPGKKLLLKNGEVQVYVRKTNQTTHYDARKNREGVESFMALGFGGRGHDLTKSFEVRYAGTETVLGVPTYKLELTPKAKEVRNMFPLITLWIDQSRGVSVQQRLDQGEGDYRVAKFTKIDINLPKLPDDAFKLKTK
jgi:outer membrane lipoprotein-sorting protein